MRTSTALARARRLGRHVRWLGMHLTRKLATLSVAEWRYLLEAQVALLRAQLLVWVRPLGGLVDSAPTAGAAPGSTASASPPVGPSPAAVASPSDEVVSQQLALAVRRAAAYGVFRPLCLVRSVALNRMLERHGLHGSRIRVGVRWADGKFAAHAWVEREGQVLGDDAAHVGSFADLSDVRVLKWS